MTSSHASLALVAALSLALGAIGCSGESAREDDASEETVGDAEGALTARAHFAPKAAELSWRPGCGIQLPNGQHCYMGLELAFTKQYVDLKTSIRTTVNNTAHTITVKLDNYSSASSHSHVAPQEESKQLGMPSKLQMSGTYAAKVVDYRGNELWSGDIRPSPAP